MTVPEAILAGVIAAVVTAVAMPWVIRLLAEHTIDRPSARSLHTVPMPRGGGLGVLTGVVVASSPWWGLADAGVALAVVVVAIVVFGLVGFIDDLRMVPFQLRLVIQIALATLLTSLIFTDTGWATWVAVAIVPLAVLWFTGFVNVFNFMDGINGISAITTAIIGTFLAIVAWDAGIDEAVLLGAVLAGAAIGYLPYNFPHPRVFLGDVGSYALGSGLAVCAALLVRSGVDPIALGAPFVLYLGDAGVTLARRIAHHDEWWEPHREHAYQRLARGSWGHTRTALVMGAITVVLALIGLASSRSDAPAVQAATVAVCGAIAVAFLVVADRWGERT